MSAGPQLTHVSRAHSAHIRKAALYWLAGLAVLAAGGLLVCPQGDCPLNAFDRAGLAYAREGLTTGLDPWLRGLTWVGSVFLLLPLAALAAWRLGAAGQWPAGAFVVSALLGATALAHLAKLWVARPRPELFPAELPMPVDWSYPSAHTMQVTALALALYLAGGPAMRRWALPLGLIVLAVAISRVYLQVHFPSDVLAGMLAAVLWVLGLHAWWRGARA